MLSVTRAALVCWLTVVAVTAQAALAPGDIPPEKVGFDLRGNPVTLSDYPGKAVVVTFWATWCAYCLKELPILHNIQTKVGKEHIQVVAVNTEEREVFRRAARALGELNVLHARDIDKESQKAFGVKGIPHMVIIGRDGKIVAVHRGYDEESLPQIASDINKALAAPTKP